LILATVSVVASAITWIPSTTELARYPISPHAVAVSIAAALAICGFLGYCWRTHPEQQEAARLQSSEVST